MRQVLFVDDDPIMRQALAAHFAIYRDRFTVDMAIDGFDAVKKLEKSAYSLIILDLVMPRMDGMSLLSHVHNKYPDIPAIVISGACAKEMRHLATMSGIIACFTKPFQAEDLSVAIMSTLQREAESGIMYDISPAVFLQLMEMDRKTCTIRILDKGSKDGGTLYFLDGQLVDARIGSLRGINAAYHVFTWDAVTVFIRNECAPRPDIINSDLQPIIMKAAGMKDEAGAPTDFTDPDDFDDDLDDLATPIITDAQETTPLADLDDLPDLIIDDLFEDSVTVIDDEVTENREDSAFMKIRKLIRQQGDADCEIGDIHYDATKTITVEKIKQLGVACNLGAFQVGSVTDGIDSMRYILPGQPPVIINTRGPGQNEKILKALREYTKKAR